MIERSAKFMGIWGVCLFLFSVFIYFISGILLPFLTALILAYALNPGVERLEKWGVPRLIATCSVVLVLFLSIGGFLFGIIPFLKAELMDLIHNLPSYSERAYTALIPFWEKLNGWEYFNFFQQKLSDHIEEMLSWIMKVIVNVLTSGMALANLISLVVITPILVFYLLRDWTLILKNVEKNLPKPYTQTIVSLGKEINKTLGGYVRGQAIVCLALTLIYTTGLWLVDFQYAFVVGGISGLLAFIPYVGFLTGLTVAVGLAFSQFSDLGSVGLVALVYGGAQVLEATLLTPKLVGDRIGLHPVWIIFALLVGGTLFGFMGVLFALPLAAMIGVLMRALMRVYRGSVYYKTS